MIFSSRSIADTFRYTHFAAREPGVLNRNAWSAAPFAAEFGAAFLSGYGCSPGPILPSQRIRAEGSARLAIYARH